MISKALPSGAISFILIALNALVGLSSGMLGFNLSLWLYEKIHKPEVMAVSVFCYAAPKIYMSFIAGTLTDKLGKDRVMRGAVLVLVLLYATMALMWRASLPDNTAVLLVYALEGLLGLTAAFYDVALLSSVSAFVPPKRYATTYGFMEICSNSSVLLTPVLGSLVYPLMPLPSLFGASACCTLILLGFLWVIPFPPALQKQLHKPLWSLEAFQFIWRDTLLRRLLVYFTGLNICQGLTAGLLIAYVLQRCGGDILSLSTFNFCLALGTMAGSLLTLKNVPLRPWSLIRSGGLVAALFGRIWFGRATSLFSLCLLGAIRGGLIPLTNTANQVLWSERTAPEQRGSVFGARRLIAQGGYPLSILLGGLLFEGVDAVFHQSLGDFFVIVGFIELLFVSLFLFKKDPLKT